jgi:MSHA biogenesis protein MshN
MSVINDMLRDLDRRNAPAGASTVLKQTLRPAKGSPAARRRERILLGAAVVLALVAFVWIGVPMLTRPSAPTGLGADGMPIDGLPGEFPFGKKGPGGRLIRDDAKAREGDAAKPSAPQAAPANAATGATPPPAAATPAPVNAAPAPTSAGQPPSPSTSGIAPPPSAVAPATTSTAPPVASTPAPQPPVPAPPQTKLVTPEPVTPPAMPPTSSTAMQAGAVPSPVTSAPARPATSTTAAARPAPATTIDVIPPLVASRGPLAASRPGDESAPRASAASALQPVAIAPRPAAPARDAATSTAIDPEAIQKRIHVTPRRTADAELAKAVGVLNQGRVNEAIELLRAALAADATHEVARQTLAALQIEQRRLGEAQATLAEGLESNPGNTSFALLAARVAIEQGNAASAAQLLRRHASAGRDNADYRALTGNVLARMGRHEEAVAEYTEAVRLAPTAGVWWTGLGMSQHALGARAEALAAFQRALETGSLPQDVATFVDQRVKQLR